MFYCMVNVGYFFFKYYKANIVELFYNRLNVGLICFKIYLKKIV